MIINVRIHRMMIAVTGATLLILMMILLLFKGVFTGSDTGESQPPSLNADIYGEFLPWKDVDKLFPRGSNAVVVDVDSGISFQVQRRGGSSHVDAQPLTAGDSAAMKEAYGGRWSWKRRAVLVVLPEGRKIAASMAGMPHGQGAIANNDFDGHFCIHFRDSKTHGSRKTDLAHQIMIWKASGTIDEHTKDLDPEGVIALLFTALDQHEYSISRQLIHPDIDVNPLLLQLQQIERIRCDTAKALGGDQFSVDVSIIFADSTQEVRQKAVLTVYGEESPFKIAASSLLQLLERQSVTVFYRVDDNWYSLEDWER